MQSVVGPQLLVGLFLVERTQVDELGTVGRGGIDQHLVIGGALIGQGDSPVVLPLR